MLPSKDLTGLQVLGVGRWEGAGPENTPPLGVEPVQEQKFEKHCMSKYIHSRAGREDISTGREPSEGLIKLFAAVDGHFNHMTYAA